MKIYRQSPGEFNSANEKSVDKPSKSSGKRSNKSAVDTSIPILNKTTPVQSEKKIGVNEQNISRIGAKRNTILIQDFRLRRDSNDPDKINTTTPLLDQIVQDMIAKKKGNDDEII